MRCVFFGTPHFAATVLKHLLQNSKHQIVAIVSKPDKPQGRKQQVMPTVVKSLRDALAPQIPLFQPLKASDPEFVEQLKSLNADVFIVVAYGEIVKKSVLDIPKLACLNIHASLLPLYRGAAPMQRCLIDGVTETGVTIMRMDVGLDSGDMLLQKKCPVPHDMTLDRLSLALQEISCAAIDEALELIATGKAEFTPQNHALATFCPKITKEESCLNFSESAESLHNRIRAFSPLPGAWTIVYIRGEKKRLKIFETIVRNDLMASPGQVVIADSLLGVGTGSGVLVLKTIQLEGKNTVLSSEFLRGYSLENIHFTP